MIIDYSNVFFEYLNSKINDFNLDYLKSDDVFNKNYIFIINDVPIGLISFSIIYDRIELNYIWVDESYRKQGIASKMIDFMLKNDDILNVTLEVRTDNVGAINLYKKYGFKVVSIRKGYYGNCDAYLMMREMM